MTSDKSTKNPESTAPKQLWVALAFSQEADPGIGKALRELDAHPVYFPSLHIEPLNDYALLDRALERFCTQDSANDSTASWLVLGSPAAAQAVSQRIHTLGLQDVLPLSRLAALGAATGRQLLATDTIDHGFQQLEGIEESHDSLTDHIPASAQIILPVAQHAYEPLARRLQRRGYALQTVPAYTRFPADGGDPVGHLLFQGRIDAVIFRHPEELRFFRRRLLNEGGVLNMLDHVQVHCLDAYTASVARDYGLRHAQVIGPPSQGATAEIDPRHIADTIRQSA